MYKKCIKNVLKMKKKCIKNVLKNDVWTSVFSQTWAAGKSSSPYLMAACSFTTFEMHMMCTLKLYKFTITIYNLGEISAKKKDLRNKFKYKCTNILYL